MKKEFNVSLMRDRNKASLELSFEIGETTNLTEKLVFGPENLNEKVDRRCA